jgi:hypothetical protein
MPALSDRTELVAYLIRTTRLSANEADRIVAEILAYMDETPEDFIRRRHLKLQAEGCSNSEIFGRIATELQEWRFRSIAYSERQIRRVIYG